MSLMPVDQALQQFHADDYTVRLVNAIFKVVPYSPVLPVYASIEDAARAINPGPNPMIWAKSREIAQRNQDIQDVLWMSRLIDTADKGIAMFSGLKSVFNVVRGNDNALETDTAQRNDAILKAVGMAYMAYNAFPGSMLDRAEAFRTTPSGQALTLYYAAIEVALPFADNLATAGGGFIEQMINKDGAAQAERLASMAGGKSIDGAMGMLQSMTGGIQRVVDHASKYAKPIAESAKQYAPGALGTADKVAGVVAGAADMFPVYTYLGGRLAAEGAVIRAMKG